jgi:hypothetical protein
MRYRITLEQVMTTWYAAVTSWEPDGLTLQKHTAHYSFPMSEDFPDNLEIALSRLVRAMELSAA